MRPPFRLRSLLLGCLWSVLIWTALGLAFAAQLVVTGSLEWEQALRFPIHDWAPWVALSPLVYALTTQFPLERGRWPLSLVVHVCACIVTLAACEWITHFIEPSAQPPREALGRRFRAGEDPEMGPRPRPLPGEAAREGGRLADHRPRPPFPHVLPGGAFSARVRVNLPIYWIIVSVAHALLFYRRSQERERKALELAAGLAQAKLQALRMQLQPHFLFNTLNAISTLVHRDARAADEMIGNLSDFLRLTLETADQQEIPLRQELEFLDHYLAIEQVRFGDRLEVIRDLTPEVFPALVPSLILQPLVENAIRHGLEPNRQAGRLVISASRDGGVLRLAVRDNGVGLKAASGREGIGLANTRARLFELYGGAARLDLKGGPEGGLAVEITLPLHSEPLHSPANAVLSTPAA
ncbi:MAG TPA: histidine kinase [Candidatus Limnocylindria bacterium]|nr:histidine kinase [Candidatus Limnocylindria bacterium]